MLRRSFIEMLMHSCCHNICILSALFYFSTALLVWFQMTDGCLDAGDDEHEQQKSLEENNR